MKECGGEGKLEEVPVAKIVIGKSATADTRTCDVTQVTVEMLKESSKQHISDVAKGMRMLAGMLLTAADKHDQTKLTHINEFFADFRTKFEKTDWWVMHQKVERHHFNNPEHIQEDINLLDVLEQIVDGVMAGLARSGKYRYEPLSSELLQKAYNNTAKLLINAVEVLDDQDHPFSLRGYHDAYHDHCENNPFGSVGGLSCRKDMRVPIYIPVDKANLYLRGYSEAVLEMYGPGWQNVDFSWKPVMELKNSREGRQCL